MRFRLDIDGETREVEVGRTEGGFAVRVDNASYQVRARAAGDSTEVRIGARTYHVRLRGNEAFLEDRIHRLQIVPATDEAAPIPKGPAKRTRVTVEVRSPMPGRVVRVAVAEGASVRRGQALIVLEAMKMQNEITSPGDGVVRAIRVSEGETVTADRVVASIELSGPSAS